MNNHEQHKHHESHEHAVDHNVARQHHERLRVHHEKAAERGDDRQRHEHEARHEAHEQAIAGAEYHKPLAEQRQPLVPTTKADKEHSFDTTMAHVRHHLSAPERSFSKLIHKPAVEKTSEVLGRTVARPSGIIGATIAAFIGLLSVYGIAKFAGFALSGSEMPLLLLSGFVMGLLIEWVLKSIRSLIVLKNG